MATPIMRSLFDMYYPRILEQQLNVGWMAFGNRGEYGNFFNNLLQPTGNSITILKEGHPNVYHEFSQHGLMLFENAKARVLNYTEMPMTMPLRHIPTSLYDVPIQSFLLGLTSPTATAQDIHNRVSLWLVE